MLSQLKDFFKRNEADIVLVIGIVLIALIAFGGGWIMGNNSSSANSKVSNNDGIKIEEGVLSANSSKEPTASANEVTEAVKEQSTAKVDEDNQNSEPQKENTEKSETTEEKITTKSSSNCKYVGSKNSDIYHLPDCPGGQRIKEENKRCFGSKSEAEKAGYRPAKNCPGI